MVSINVKQQNRWKLFEGELIEELEILTALDSIIRDKNMLKSEMEIEPTHSQYVGQLSNSSLGQLFIKQILNHASTHSH